MARKLASIWHELHLRHTTAIVRRWWKGSVVVCVHVPVTNGGMSRHRLPLRHQIQVSLVNHLDIAVMAERGEQHLLDRVILIHYWKTSCSC